jgi:hypothetical protein
MKQKLGFISLSFFVLIIISCSQKNESHFVKFKGESYQKNWAITVLNPELPTDWSSHKYLTFEYNASSTQRFYLNLYDAEGIRKIRLKPFQNAWVRASIPLVHFKKEIRLGWTWQQLAKQHCPDYVSILPVR